jgi:hypothetical protein
MITQIWLKEIRAETIENIILFFFVLFVYIDYLIIKRIENIFIYQSNYSDQ